MNNLSSSMKKFLGNKNTVTILGVVLCLVVLYVGYVTRINQEVKLVDVPVANESIPPRTEITNDMITTKELPAALLEGSFYRDVDKIVGMYTNYSTTIPKYSLFYSDLLVESKYLPDAIFTDIPDGYTVVNYKVNMDSTYANSMMPENYIDIYFKAVNEDDQIMFGKFIGNVEILSVKDASGLNVFENSAEVRTPAYMMFALEEEIHLLFRKAIYLADEYDVELILVPSNVSLDEENVDLYVSSKDIKDFINDRTDMVDVDEIKNETKDELSVQNEQQ